MKTFIKFLSRNKLYTAINIIGLSVSLMFVILIANFVVTSLTVDSKVEKADRIYAISNEKYMGTGYWNGQHLKARYPEVEEACGISGGNGNTLSVYINNREYGADLLFADTTFFQMFSIPLIEGDPKNALISKDNVIISKSFADKVFGSLNPVGMSITFEENDVKKERVIAGIMPDIENSVLPDADIVTNFLNIGNYNSGIISEYMNNAGATVMFLLEREGADLRSRTGDIAEYFKTYFWPYMRGALKEVVLVPFKDIYFSDYKSDATNYGDWSFVVILISVGILVLLFAIVNYINLTVAQTGFRAKEMATRRLLGASRKELFGKLITESLLMCFAAFVIGFLLAVALEHSADYLLQTRISLISNLNGTYFISYSTLIVIVALLSGSIPAFIISNFQPIEVVRGAFRRKTGMVYSKILITFQNIITIALIGGSITMFWQIRYMINAPMGYTYKNIIDISTWNGFKDYGQVKTTVNELKQLSFIEGVGQSLGTPLSGGNNNTIAYGKDRMVSFQVLQGDPAFYKMLNLKIKTDYKLTDGWYFNEYAFKEMELPEDSPVIKLGPEFESDYKVSGIFYDFRVRNALREPTACLLKIIESFEKINETETKMYPWNILVKVSDNMDKAEAFNKVQEVVKNITGSNEVDIQYIEDKLKESYKDQKRTSDIVLIFTFIAILISSLGLLAMSTYFIQQRRMEIAVRKVFGSTREEMLGRLIKTFMKMVGAAFIISIPITWYLMSRWLEDYSYKISLSPLIFAGAGILSSLIALITVFWQSKRASDENPVEAIKR